MEKHRLEGIDYLRAIMSIFVVIWHMNGGGRSLIFSSAKYINHTFTISDFVNFHILLLAVPSFILISNVLYALKKPDNITLHNRIKRILILVTFWPIVLTIYNNSYNGLTALLPHSFSSFLLLFFTAGHTIYFFFISLLACTLITHSIARIRLRIQLFGFVLSLIILASLPALTKVSSIYYISAYWNPMNFIPFPFAAILIAQNMDYVRSHSARIITASLILFILLSIFEWRYSVGSVFFPGQGFAIPAYTRVSLLFGCIALSIIAINPSVRSNTVIKYMADNSLALYCLHPFFMEPANIFLAKLVHNQTVSTFIAIMIIIVLSYLSAWVLKIYVKERVIT